MAEIPEEPLDRARGASPPAADAALKRALDLAIGVPVCVALLPVLGAVALAIKLDSEGPVLFRQARRGQHFRAFTVNKFRSLAHGKPDPHARYEMLERDPRITRVGAFIRRTSLDELPQIFNVIGGSMSLVGPRPLVEWESREALATHPERFHAKPGITGLSQVEVRNAADFVTRLDKDREYVHRFTPWLDLVILARTPLALLRGAGIYPESKAGPRPRTAEARSVS
jgi:lipopolysaccharide/colanic/teichoic acid biosynthesis glycosyltransferase